MFSELLDGFLRRAVSQYGIEKATRPELLAEEWVKTSALSPLPCLSEIARQLERYGVKELRPAPLPGLRGHHFSYRGGDYTILLEDGAWRGTTEFTSLHEFYEILLERLEVLFPLYHRPPHPEICWLANAFAAAVLMQADLFLPALYETNFDIIKLHQRFYRSYSAIAIRAVELLNRQEPEKRREFMCAIYRRKGKIESWENPQREDFQVGCAVYTSGLRIGKGNYLRQLVPKVKDLVAPASIADRVIQLGKPLLAERVTGFDSRRERDLTVLARPVFWQGKLGKVVLVAVRYCDGYVLQAQAERLNHEVIRQTARLV